MRRPLITHNTKPVVPVFGDPMKGLRLGVALDKPIYRQGENPLLRVTLLNSGDEAFPLTIAHGGMESSINVRGPDGKSVPLTRFGEREAASTPYSYRISQLKPGQPMESFLVLNRLYDMSLEGTYTIVLSRVIAKEGDRPIVLTSGTATLEMKGELSVKDLTTVKEKDQAEK